VSQFTIKEIASLNLNIGPALIAIKGSPESSKDTTSQSPDGVSCRVVILLIFDSGKTVIECSKILKENGAKKVLVYATHGLFTLGTKNILESFDNVMTSNTFYLPKEEDGNIEIIDMAPLFAEAIYRAQEGLSVSKLFD